MLSAYSALITSALVGELIVINLLDASAYVVLDIYMYVYIYIARCVRCVCPRGICCVGCVLRMIDTPWSITCLLLVFGWRRCVSPCGIYINNYIYIRVHVYISVSIISIIIYYNIIYYIDIDVDIDVAVGSFQ